MKVLFIVFKALLGGHVLSAFTTAKEMRKYGIEPVFSGANGAMTEEIRKEMPFEEINIPIYQGTKQTYFTIRSFSTVNKIRQIITKHKIDLIHAFDARSYMHAYPAGLLESTPVICTLCGGVDPYYNLPLASKLIVFSEEQKHKMVSKFKWPVHNVDVIRTRLDLSEIKHPDSLFSDEEAEEFGFVSDLQKIMMISSFDGTKIKSIHKVIDAVEILYNKGYKFQLVLIGGKGQLFDEVNNRCASINKAFGKNFIVLTGRLQKAFRLLQQADIVIGVGRSAFEGMAYGCPTLIVGENGFAGTVQPDEIEGIAWYNFSGRNQKIPLPANKLSNQIERLFKDSAYAKEIGTFSKAYISSQIDVVNGSGKIFERYQIMIKQKTIISKGFCWFSFTKCLLPIFMDQAVHILKKSIRNESTD
nr:glycosyltransferase family 4 protein [uncultured Desulfobacter sp.]